MWQINTVFLLLLVVLTVNNVGGVYVSINSTTGNLLSIDATTYFQQLQNGFASTNYSLWVTSNTQGCSTLIDTHYNTMNNENAYTIEDWCYFLYDYGNYGAFALDLSIHDLQAFATRAFLTNVWSPPLDCGIVWTRMQQTILIPVVQMVGFQDPLYLSASGFGVTVDFLCRVPGSPLADFGVCTGTQFIELLQLNPGLSNIAQIV